ncbi:hypothetical protein BPNPMPFG_003642 [Mesorhizobium sp. AR07]|uniref:hypothetical protein n=1 Tax=Mesorhizobium sp. AR07 TaxID=2865838 RepID=UPI002160D9B0|nr:hypothetical protein [Mesorhizobium sp. AR07]UVK42009.1 hypothetical protein BPNPMPFG_003642 [Mesorhizobium sp. AR07]
MKTERFQMSANPDFLKLVDNWRRSQPDIPARAEAIRRIVANALDTTEAPSLSALVRDWFASNPTRLALFGFDGSVTVEQAVDALLKDRYQSPVIPAKLMLEAFQHEADPIAKQIVALLQRLA